MIKTNNNNNNKCLEKCVCFGWVPSKTIFIYTILLWKKEICLNLVDFR